MRLEWGRNMKKAEVRLKLKSIYSLLSIGEANIALKTAFEMLLHVASQDAKIKETEFERLSLLGVINILFRFLTKKDNGYRQIEYFFDDLIVLSVYYDSVNRELNISNLVDSSQLLTNRILGILEWYSQEPRSGYYTIDSFDSSLLTANELMFDNESIQRVTVLSAYYYIETRFYKTYQRSFWNEAIHDIRFVFDEELSWINDFRDTIDSFLTAPDEMVLGLQDYEISYIYEEFILKNFNIDFVVQEINGFRRSDDVVGKKIYKEINQQKEASFHKHIFSYFSKFIDKHEILLSELPFNDNRYDIYWHNMTKNSSSIIELKVNNLREIMDNIDQLKDYITRVNSIVFYEKPQFGVLCIYNTGRKNADFIVEKLDTPRENKPDYAYEVLDDCIYLKYERIVIALIG